MQLGRWMVAGLVVCSAACSSAPTAKGLAQDAVTAMGGAEQLRGVQTLVMSGGSGTRRPPLASRATGSRATNGGDREK